MSWYYLKGGRREGPIDDPVIRRMAALGELEPTDLVWCPGMKAWTQAATVPGLLQPPPVPLQGQVDDEQAVPESYPTLLSPASQPRFASVLPAHRQPDAGGTHELAAAQMSVGKGAPATTKSSMETPSSPDEPGTTVFRVHGREPGTAQDTEFLVVAPSHQEAKAVAERDGYTVYSVEGCVEKPLAARDVPQRMDAASTTGGAAPVLANPAGIGAAPNPERQPALEVQAQAAEKRSVGESSPILASPAPQPSLALPTAPQTSRRSDKTAPLIGQRSREGESSLQVPEEEPTPLVEPLARAEPALDTQEPLLPKPKVPLTPHKTLSSRVAQTGAIGLYVVLFGLLVASRALGHRENISLALASAIGYCSVQWILAGIVTLISFRGEQHKQQRLTMFMGLSSALLILLSWGELQTGFRQWKDFRRLQASSGDIHRALDTAENLLKSGGAPPVINRAKSPSGASLTIGAWLNEGTEHVSRLSAQLKLDLASCPIDNALSPAVLASNQGIANARAGAKRRSEVWASYESATENYLGILEARIDEIECSTEMRGQLKTGFDKSRQENSTKGFVQLEREICDLTVDMLGWLEHNRTSWNIVDGKLIIPDATQRKYWNTMLNKLNQLGEKERFIRQQTQVEGQKWLESMHKTMNVLEKR